MKIFPAIDIRDKKVVRLTQGDYDKMTVYSSNPVEIAKQFKADGAKCMHVVDLDGALNGEAVNFDTISAIVSDVGMFVEVGGGIRDEERIKKYLGIGVGRVILGTAAIENPSFADRMFAKYGDRIAVGVDAKDGKVATRGWKTVTDVDSFDFCYDLVSRGCNYVIYTDISRDGLLAGSNLEAYKHITQIWGLHVTASGGISSAEELKTLKSYGVYGAVLGKSLYDGKLTLAEALKAAKE